MKNKLSVIAALCAMAVLITASPQVIASCRDALTLCCELIIPSLFPFFVISVLLSRLGLPAYLEKLLSPLSARLFGVSGAGATALFVGLTGGYPLGASYIADMHQQGHISAQEAERLLAFCNNSGPAFIIGAVGSGVFSSPKAGLLLYAVHILSALLTGLIFRQNSPPRSYSAAKPPSVSLSQALPDSVRQAVVSILNVCGFVVCFSVFAGLLDSGGFFPVMAGRLSALLGKELHWCRALLTGILELGSGAGAMRGLALSPANLALAAWILGWGGISVHFQTMAVIADADIKSGLHFAGRLVSAFIGAGITYLAGLLLL